MSLASVLHYNQIRNAEYGPRGFAEEGNTEFLRRGAAFTRIKDASLIDIKAAMRDAGLDCRLVE